MEPLFKLGATIFGTILKIASKNDKSEFVVDGLLQLADIADNDLFAKREIERTSQLISDSISKSCYQILSHHQITDERADVFYKKIADTIEIRLLSFSDNSVEIPKKHSIDLCALMYVLAIIVLVVGLSMEKEISDSVDLNTITLLSFALIFLGYWMDSRFSRELSNISKYLDEFEKKNSN